jgi:2-C-methyl-D-erythritol 4-phosphate cytidylyltransferase
VELSAIVPLPISIGDEAPFVPLAGESSLVRVVRAMLGAVTEPRRVVVAAAERLVGEVRQDLVSQGLSSVSIANAGARATRAQCLSVALEYLENEAFPSRYVLLHEVSRPMVSAGVWNRVVDGLRQGNGVVMPALPVTDSVKAVDARGSVTATVDRSTLRAVQFPRGFTTGQLSQLISLRTSEDFDELAEAIRAGVAITLVDGDPDGFPAELPRDSQFLEAVIASRRPDLRDS